MKRYAASAASLVSAFALPAGAEVLDSIGEYGNAATANATSGAGTARGALYEDPTAGAYSITAGGTDIWGNSDNGSFIYDADGTRAAGEDFSVIVRSISVAGDPLEGLATQWGRTGPMARVDPSAANSAYVANIRKSVGTTIIQGRDAAGAGTNRGPGNNGEFPNAAANGDVRTNAIWLGLHRFDGEWYGTWADDAAGTPGTWSDAIHRVGTAGTQGEVYVGLAHQSHNINPVVNTALFDNFAVGAFDNSLGNFPTTVSCDLALDASGPAVTASGVELGDPASVDVDWEVRYIGDPETVAGVLAADIYFGRKSG